MSNFGLAAIKREGTIVCRYCYFEPHLCICHGPLLCPHGIDRDKTCPTCQVEKPLQSIELREDYR